MDLERLTKTQIILLTLLVSFVTSIATGIATVSLMEKAPTDVTRVISRIVEKPIETIGGGGRTVVEQHTVVVSEGDRIADAVKKAQSSIVRIYTVSGKDDLEFQGFGIIVSADGTVLADTRMIDKEENYAALLANGTRLPAEPSDIQTERGYFRLDTTGVNVTFTPATLTAFSTLTLGQTVVAISGEIATRIAPGVIAELTPPEAVGSPSRVRATIDSGSIVFGAPLIDLSGGVIGMPEDEQSQIFLTLRETSTP